MYGINDLDFLLHFHVCFCQPIFLGHYAAKIGLIAADHLCPSLVKLSVGETPVLHQHGRLDLEYQGQQPEGDMREVGICPSVYPFFRLYFILFVHPNIFISSYL